MHKIKSLDIYNRTSVGDEFYIVTIDNKKAFLAYSAKMFEYTDCK